jgi:hypothetical protein
MDTLGRKEKQCKEKAQMALAGERALVTETTDADEGGNGTRVESSGK